jgi:hypothetical protein
MMIVLPSSESNYLDTRQYHESNSGKGINSVYPYQSGFISLYATYPSGVQGAEKPSIYSYVELYGRFSSGINYSSLLESNPFNNYIHYYPRNYEDVDKNDVDKDNALRIPYLSSYRVSLYAFNPYAPRF